MGLIFRLVELLLVIVPLAGAIYAAKLLDFPAMTDMGDPLTVVFHRAKLALRSSRDVERAA
ncbi:MAG: hypothetical protein WBO08_08630 [Mycobacterium sp.]